MDALDALIYFIRNLNMAVNPFPVNYDLMNGREYDSSITIYRSDGISGRTRMRGEFWNKSLVRADLK